MGDTDGSSEAAQSARLADEFDSMEIVEEDTPKSGGFFSRVMGALSASGHRGERDSIPAGRPVVDAGHDEPALYAG